MDQNASNLVGVDDWEPFYGGWCNLTSTSPRYLWWRTRRPAQRTLTRVMRTIDLVAGLDDTNRQTIHVSVYKPGHLGLFVLGSSDIGDSFDIGITTTAIAGRAPDWGHPVDRKACYTGVAERNTLLVCVLAHEMGHARDRRSDACAELQWLMVNQVCSPIRKHLPEPTLRPREAFAECWAEWYLSQGTTTNLAAQWYARRNKWRKDW